MMATNEGHLKPAIREPLPVSKPDERAGYTGPPPPREKPDAKPKPKAG